MIYKEHMKVSKVLRLLELLEQKIGTDTKDFTLKIKFVDGDDVRKKHKDDDPKGIEFTMGGHWLAYTFIPEGEIWIDKVLTLVSQISTLIHEVAELLLMLYFKVDYDTAHEKVADGCEEVVRDFLAKWDKSSGKK